MDKQSKILNNWDCGEGSDEEAELSSDGTGTEHEADKRAIDDMRGIMRKMDLRLTSINKSTETTFAELRSELRIEIERGEKRDQALGDSKTETAQLKLEIAEMVVVHAAKVEELNLVISSLQETVDNLVEYQKTTVGVLYSCFITFTDLKLY